MKKLTMEKLTKSTLLAVLLLTSVASAYAEQIKVINNEFGIEESQTEMKLMNDYMKKVKHEHVMYNQGKMSEKEFVDKIRELRNDFRESLEIAKIVPLTPLKMNDNDQFNLNKKYGDLIKLGTVELGSMSRMKKGFGSSYCHLTTEDEAAFNNCMEKSPGVASEGRSKKVETNGSESGREPALKGGEVSAEGAK